MRLFTFLDNYTEVVFLIITLSLMSLFIGLQVFMRYIAHASLSWSEEVSRYLFIYLVNIGISYGVKTNRHVTISFFIRLFPETVRHYILVVSDVLFFLFSSLVTVHGVKVAWLIGNLGQKSPALGIPMWIVYSAVPVGFALLSIRLIQRIYNRIFRKI